MNTRDTVPGSSTAPDYLRDNFPAGDRLAVVVLNRRTQGVIQRLGSLEQITAPDFNDWLKDQNARRCEIYISMNALHGSARGRTKEDVASIRHIYLDFDENGTAALERLLNRGDMPRPTYVLSSSPDKWQVTWKVEGFEKAQAELLQKNLAWETGADPAATDCARVLRVPGFYNHKYDRPYLVRAEHLSAETYRPEHFPSQTTEYRAARVPTEPGATSLARPTSIRRLSQSERDWAFAKRALARGESPALVAATIASYRRFDKPDPQYYAELTVRKAIAALHRETARSPERT